jgi:3D (Asp-Asp-Asp) domain-containing protein
VTALATVVMALRLMGWPAQVATMSVSAYTNAGGAPPYQGLTASGQYTRPGICACGPSFPFGTIFVVSGKWYVCQDRGSAITDGHLDLWVGEDEEAWAWGRRQMQVVVVR